METPMPELRDAEPVEMGLGVNGYPFQNALYIILVLLGIVGNATVVGVISESVFKDPSGGRNSDIILINMALSNLLLSLLRNVLLVMSDLGLEVRSWMRLLQGSGTVVGGAMKNEGCMWVLEPMGKQVWKVCGLGSK
ncbi:uncharacterized protein LOC112254551 [Oncorhynchus tshawytscha]|uniref:uncharacterized protein LOC112254551 n=1 Tax=Oncorhynchus tshawytscha TaxID=74940 RepID=UPI001C3D06AD|nr:uncharacterized protein LOC112254551 [Oncorhynchus tshawytscha]